MSWRSNQSAYSTAYISSFWSKVPGLPDAKSTMSKHRSNYRYNAIKKQLTSTCQMLQNAKWIAQQCARIMLYNFFKVNKVNVGIRAAITITIITIKIHHNAANSDSQPQDVSKITFPYLIVNDWYGGSGGRRQCHLWSLIWRLSAVVRVLALGSSSL